MLINVQAQYELKNNIVEGGGQIKLILHHQDIFHDCQIVHQDPLNAKQSSHKNKPVCAM